MDKKYESPFPTSCTYIHDEKKLLHIPLHPFSVTPEKNAGQLLTSHFDILFDLEIMVHKF